MIKWWSIPHLILWSTWQSLWLFRISMLSLVFIQGVNQKPWHTKTHLRFDTKTTISRNISGIHLIICTHTNTRNSLARFLSITSRTRVSMYEWEATDCDTIRCVLGTCRRDANVQIAMFKYPDSHFNFDVRAKGWWRSA